MATVTSNVAGISERIKIEATLKDHVLGSGLGTGWAKDLGV